MDEQKPKPGDVIKPNSAKPVQPLVDAVPAPVEAPPAPSAPPITEVKPEPLTLDPTPEVTPPAVPPPVEPTPTATPPTMHKKGPIFAVVLFVVLVLVGLALYFLYFREMMEPAPAPVEIRETTESTAPDRTTQQDTTSLQYLENEFSRLEDESNALTDEMEAESELNLGTSTNTNSEL